MHHLYTTSTTGRANQHGTSRNLRAAAISCEHSEKRKTLKIFILCATLLAALLVFLLPGAAKAAVTGEGMRVVYGFDREFPPFSYENPGGKATGFEVELIETIFQGTGAHLSFRPLQWERVGVELSSGTISLTTGMVRTKNRAKLYLFSNLPSFPLQIRLFTKIYNRFPSLALMRGQMVSVEKGSYQHRLLESYGGMNIKPYPNRVDGLRALYNDEVAAYCAPVQSAYYYINKLNYGAITTVGTPLGITEMRIAVNRSRGDVLKLVNERLAEVVTSGEYDRLYRKWFVRELVEQERDVMLDTAVKAAIPAYAPYGKNGYGAAVLTATGKVYSACTVENADPRQSISALRSAIARAVADGEFELRAAVCVDPEGNIQQPDSADLQTLHEFGRGILVIQKKQGDTYETAMVSQLLPNPVEKDTGLIYIE